jgi:cytochrome P450
LTHEELAGMSVVLLGAGHETTGNMTALGVLALLSHDDQFARLGRQPELVPEAVDELLRYLSIIDNAVRVATTDIEVGGELIKAGDAIVAVLSAANRDDAVFQQPNELDPARPARNHVAFGHGIHVCLGAPLARLELQVAYEGLTRRIPSLRLAVAEDEIRFKSDAAAYGVHELPVTW